MLVMIDGPMIERFIDHKSFPKCTDDRFQELDGDRDGLLLRDDLRWGFSVSVASDYQPSSEFETEDVASADKLVFEKFDVDGGGSIDRKEFRSMMTEILTAIARGIGPMPVIVGVEENSLLMKAYECESARIALILADIADGKLKDEEIDIEIIRGDLKKRSKKIFGIGMCACSPKYLGED